MLGRQLALAVSVADVLLPELPFPPPLNTDLDQQRRGKAHFASSVCPLVPECAFPRESCPVIALLSTAAAGTVGAGALLPLLMGSGASSWDPPGILHVFGGLQHFQCLEGHKINCAASLTGLTQEGH